MDNLLKRLLSFTVALVMVLGMIPVTQIEAKATTTEQQETTEELEETEADYPSAPEGINDNLAFEADGKTAYCGHCEAPVEWTALTVETTGTITTDTHYYVPEGGIANTGATANTDAADFGPNFLQVKSGTLCLHLQDNDLTTTGNIYVCGGNLNVMGTGTWTSTFYSSTKNWHGANISVYDTSYKSVVNLYGGKLVKDCAGDFACGMPYATAGGNGNKMNIYSDVEIVGGFHLSGGTVNFWGAKQTGDSVITNYGTWQTVFNMEGGELNTRIDLKRAAGSTNTAPVVFNMNGGVINGTGTSSGSAFSISEGAKLVIGGGTINGNDTDDESWGGTIYTQAPTGVLDPEKLQTEIEMTGGVVNAPGTGTVTSSQNSNVFFAGHGGAICLYGGNTKDTHPGKGTKMTMSGGTINGTQVFYQGGSLYVSSAELIISGDAKIQNGMGRIVGGNYGGNIGQGGNIYVCDSNITMNGGTISDGLGHTGTRGGGNVFVDTGSTFTMTAGTIKNGSNKWNQGGNIYILGGTFNMSGGTISGGTACNGASIAMAGVSTTDKAVFYMTGGTIENGETTSSASVGRGGNLYIGTNSEVSILGGTVTGGKAKYSGTEVYSGGGNIYLVGEGSKLTVGKNPETGVSGTISNGEATSASGGNILASSGSKVYLNEGAVISNGKSAKNVSGYGGGNIYVYNTTFTMNGGQISGGSGANGGSVLLNKATFNMYGGEITGGTTLEQAATAVLGSGGNFYLTGTSKLNVLGGKVTEGTATYCKPGTGYYGGGNICVNSGTVTVGKNPETNASSEISGGEGWSGGNILLHSAGNLVVNDGATITGGHATGVPYISNAEKGTRTNVHGGGNIYASDGKITMNGGTVSKGVAEANGGNIMLNSNASLTVTGGLITEGVSNFAPGDTSAPTAGNKDGFAADWGSVGGGGNIYATGAGCRITVSNAEIRNGTAAGGGNIMTVGASIVDLNDGALVIGGVSRAPSNNTYYRGNIHTSGGTINVNTGALVADGVTSNSRVGKEISAIWKAVININGGTVGRATDGTDNLVAINASSDSPNTTLNVNGGTLYGKVYTTNNAYTKVNFGHAKYAYSPTKAYNASGTISNAHGNIVKTVTDGAVLSLHSNLYELHTVEHRDAVAATCKADGTIEHYACTVCAQAFADQTCATKLASVVNQNDLKHTQTKTEAVASSCDVNGVAAYWTCSCGALYADETCDTPIENLEDWKNDPQGGQLPMAEHNWADATCTTPKTCTVCGETEGVANGHTEVIDKAVDPTCTATGLTEGKHCSACGEVLVAQEEISALGHNMDAGVVTTPATCEVPGTTTFTCQNGCGHKTYQTIGAIGHKWDEGKVTTEPGCGSEGVKTFTCANDSSHTKTEPVAATGNHTWDTKDYVYTITDEDSLTSTVEYHCDVCGHKEVSDRYTSVSIEAPTCQSEGVKIYTHEVWNDDLLFTAEKRVTLEIVDHDFSGFHGACTYNCGTTACDDGHTYENKNSEQVTPATCEANEVRVYLCDICTTPGAQFEVENSATGHNGTQMVMKNPTCTEPGHETYYICSNQGCGAPVLADGTKIENLDAWKAEGGDGYLAPMGHQYTSYMRVEEATCSKYAVLEATCDICWTAKDRKDDVDGGKMPHDFDPTTGECTYNCGTTRCDVYGHDWQGVSATINEDKQTGKINAQCWTCKEEKTFDAVLDYISYSGDPTCTETGLIYYNMVGQDGNGYTVYGEVPETVPALGHTEVVDAAVAPSCTETGLTEGKHCSVCGEVLVAQEAVEATGHDWDEGKVTAEPTCTTPGTLTVSCKNGCGQEGYETINPTGHTPVYVEAKAPTATEEGYEDYYKCACGALFEDAEGMQPIEAPVVIPKLTVDTVIPETGVEIEGGEELTDDQKQVIEEILTKSEQVKQAQNLPDDTYLKVTMSSAKVEGEKVTRVTYQVAPIDAEGNKVSKPGQKITFYLPVPYKTAKGVAAVFHDGILLGADYQIQEKNGEYYVVVESDTFSEFAVDLNYVAPNYVAMVGQTGYTTLMEALANAKSGDVVTLTGDLILEGKDIDLRQNIKVPAGVTIDGAGYTMEVKETQDSDYAVIWSDGAYTVQNITIKVTGMRENSLTIINFKHGGVLQDATLWTDVLNYGVGYSKPTNGMTLLVEDCEIHSKAHAFYADPSDATINVTLRNNTVTSPRFGSMQHSEYVVGNTITEACSSGISLGRTFTGTVTGNTFYGKRALSVYATQTISGNNFGTTSIVELNDGAVADLSGNYWGGEAPAEGRIVADSASAVVKYTVDSYYTTVAEDGTLGGLTEIVKNVAEVNGVQYKDLQEAISAANGGTVTLINDVTYTTVYADNKSHWNGDLNYELNVSGNVTLDLNGYTIKSVGGSSHSIYALICVRSGSLTIVDNSAEKTGAVICSAETLKSSGYTIYNNGALTVSGGTISNTVGGRAIQSVTVKETSLTINEGATVVSNGIAVRVASEGSSGTHTVVINGGEISGTYALWVPMKNGGTDVIDVTINGGTFTGSSNAVLFNSYVPGADFSTDSIQVTGGEFNGNFLIGDSGAADADAALAATMQKNVISGGTFSNDVSQFCEKGYALEQNADGSYGVIEQNFVAEIDGEGYETLQAAIDAAGDGDTIVLLEDIELAAQNANALFKPAYNRESYCGVYIPDDKAVTIDLNGKVVSYVDTYGDCDNVMILNLGNLTINDTVGGGKLTYKAVAGATTYSYFYSTIFNCGTLTVNAGTIENTCETETDVTNAVDNHSRLSHEYGNDSILVVNGGTLSGAYYYAVRQYTHYFEGVKNRVTINDGTINGGIYMQHGDSWYYANPEANRLNVDCQLVINGGTITLDTTPDNWGLIKSRLSNPDNNAFSIEINGGNIEVPVQLHVQRGYYYGEDGKLVSSEANGTRNAEWLEANGGFITGGTFTEAGSGDTDLTKFVAEGYELTDNGDGTYGVREEMKIEVTDAEGNVTYLPNLKGFSTSNVTVKLLKDVADYNLNLYGATGVVLDLNGFTFSKQINLMTGSEITIVDSSAEKTGKVITDTNTVWIMNGSVVVESGTIETTSTSKAAVWANAAEVTVNGGKIISAGDAISVGENFMESRGTSTVIINSGEIQAAGYGIVNGSYSQEETSVAISGGSITSGNDSISFTTGTVAVSGGTFSTDVSDYCVDGFVCEKNEDGTYGAVVRPVPSLGGNGSILYSNGSYIHLNIDNAYVDESLVLELYAGDVLLSVTEMVNSSYLKYFGRLTANIEISRESSTWETEWYDFNPDASVVPTTIKVYADGKLVGTTKVKVTAEEWAATEGVKTYVAQIGEQKFETLAEAIEAATAGDTIVLLDDVTIVGETYTIADGVSITLDMNGKKITVTDDKAANVCYELFYIYGEMTVTGNGTIELTSTSNDTAFVKYSSIFHNRGGVLTIENGTFKHLGGTAMAFVVDNSGNYYGDATTNIVSGTLDSAYIAIRNRMEQNSHGASGKAILNISGGTVSGTKRAIWAQAASSNVNSPATGEINVSGGEIGLIDTARSTGAVSMTTVTGGTVAEFKGEAGELTVNGGTVENVTILTASDKATEYAITDTGLYTSAVAQVNGTNYATLVEALAAAKGGEVKVLCDVEESITAIENVTLTTDVEGGVTITNTYSDDYTNFNKVTVASGVTLNISDVYSSGEDSVNVIEGTLNISGVYYHSGDAKTTIRNGGKVTTGGMTIVRYNYNADSGIYIYGDGNDETVEFTCNGDAIGAYSGTFYAEDAVVQTKGLRLDYKKDNSEESDVYAAINASFKNSVLNVTSELRLYKDANFTLTGTSVTAGKVQIRENATPVVNVDSTSTVTANSVENLSGAMLLAALGTDNTVTFAPAVAKIGTKTYSSVTAAITAAQDGDTVELLADVELTESIKITGTVTVDLNGKKLTGPDDGKANWYAFIVDGGDLTLKDSVGTGEIWAKCYGVETKSGSFTMESGTITATNNKTLGSAVVNYGGTVTIKGGTLSGNLSAVYTGGYFSDAATTITGGTITGPVVVEDWTAKTFTETVSSASNTYETEEDYKWVEENGVYVLTAKNYVAQVGEQKFETLQEAIDAAGEGETIVLLSDVEYVNAASAYDKSTSVYIPAGKEFTLDLNGHVISGENNVNGGFAFVTICRGANITIDDTSAAKTGKITYKSTRDKSNYDEMGYTIRVMGALTLDGGMIENSTPLGSDDFEKCVTTAIDIGNATGAMASFTMNDGMVISNTYFAIRANVYANNNDSVTNAVVLNGGTVYGLHFCDWGSQGLNYKVTIGSDAIIERGNYVDYLDQAVRLVIGSAARSDILVDIDDNAQINGTIFSPAARIGSHYFYSLKNAVAAAQEGEITLLKDVTETAPVVAENAIIDLNGKHLKADVFATIKVNGGVYETTDYVMVGATEGKYLSTDAVFTVAPTATMDITIHSGTMTLNDPNWWTLDGQTLIIAEEANFVVPAGMNLNVNGSTVIVNGEVEVAGTVTLYSATATVQAPENLNVVMRDGIGDKVWYTEGKYVVHSHTEVTIPGKAPTLTETGLTDGVKCSVCGEILVKQEIIEAEAQATVNGTPYAKLSDALNAAYAAGGATVKLAKNVDLGSEMIMVKDKVILDLNGKTLKTTDYVMAVFKESYIVDSSTDNSGRLDVSLDNLRLLDTNVEMPVKMSDGIMFAQIKMGNSWAPTSNLYQCWIDSADDALIEALKNNKPSDLGLQFQIEIKWGNSVLLYTYSDEYFATYIVDWTYLAMRLNMRGAENTTDLTYQVKAVFGADTDAEVVVWASNVVNHNYAQ